MPRTAKPQVPGEPQVTDTDELTIGEQESVAEELDEELESVAEELDEELESGAEELDEELESGAEELDEELESGAPDDDAAIEAGQQGKARKIAKPRAPVAPAKLGPNPDSTRPQSANINAKQKMTTEEAKELDRAGKLQRPVLTEQGWHCPVNSVNERAARRKQGEPEYAEIE